MACHICGSFDGVRDAEWARCKACKEETCPDCWSPLDPNACKVCVSFQNTEIKEEPLKGEDGVTHQGRKLVLTGESWMRSRDIIANMTDVELELRLTQLKGLVHEAELALDFRRIHLSQAENEKEARQTRHRKRRMLIEGVDSARKVGSKISGSSSDKVDIAKDAIKALKGLGMDKDKIASILIALAKNKK